MDKIQVSKHEKDADAPYDHRQLEVHWQTTPAELRMFALWLEEEKMDMLRVNLGMARMVLVKKK